ncbi:proton channel OtopLc-like [Strongylocentrotus purpuratus]|uniref:Uncharacterized protein n=1 Tax=Strongylocentrotus purpuratus TaxID=7668 RepID=A0A7M7SVG3_STRPU|nr:proton channel OtopLc-like [Strongylocentrotus purpuratus]
MVDAGDNKDTEIRSTHEKQVLHAAECGSREIEALKRIEGEAPPPQHQRVYGVAMPPPPSSSNEMDTTPIAMEKEDADPTPSSSAPKRVYGVAMPPAMPKEQSIDAMEEEEEGGVVPVKSKKMYGPAMPPPSMQNTTGKRLVKGPSRGPSKAGVKGDGSSHQSVGGMLASLRDNEGEKMEESEDYTDWQPPTDQKGDGRTSLNEKLGY